MAEELQWRKSDLDNYACDIADKCPQIRNYDRSNEDDPHFEPHFCPWCGRDLFTSAVGCKRCDGVEKIYPDNPDGCAAAFFASIARFNALPHLGQFKQMAAEGHPRSGLREYIASWRGDN